MRRTSLANVPSVLEMIGYSPRCTFLLAVQLLDWLGFMLREDNMASFIGKISGFHVLRVGAAPATHLRCFAIVSEPPPPPKGKEIQVITDELSLQLALSVGATLKAEVEVSYDETNEGNRLSSVRVLDR
jgi:hypothetical protein